MKKKVIVHIGDAKTGTSSIQTYLTNNRVILRENSVLYSEVGLLGKSGIANHKLAFCLNPSRKKEFLDATQLYQQLQAEIDQTSCEYVVISSEGFCSLRSVGPIEELKRYLNKYDVRIIAYLRRPDLWLESWYPQIVKKRPFVTKTFMQYMDNHQPPSLRTILNYADVFGDNDMLVRPFERKKMHRNDLVSDFFNTIGIEKVGDAVDDVNKSPDMYVTEILRRMNSTIQLSNASRAKLNEDIVNSFVISKGSKRYLSSVMRKEFLSKYAIEIAEVNKRFAAGEEFFSIPEDEGDMRNEKYITNPSLDDVSIDTNQFLSFVSMCTKR